MMCRLFTAQGRRTKAFVFFYSDYDILGNVSDLLTLVYSPERKLCSKPLYMVRGMRVSSLQSFSSRNVARKVWRNGSLLPRNWLVCSRSMLSRNTATMIMASTPTPTTQHRTHTVGHMQNTVLLPVSKKAVSVQTFIVGNKRRRKEGPSTNVTSVTLSNAKQNAAKTGQTGGSVKTSVTQIKFYEIKATFTVKM